MKKPEGWVPKPAIHLLVLALTYSSVFLLPFASNTPSFMTVTALSRVLPFIPLSLPFILPESFGTINSQPHATYNTYTTIFRTIAATSALLHLKSTVLALFYNTPESHYYRHSLLYPFKEEHRSALDRGSTAIGRVFGAINEHPAVGAVGWDVILSGLSLGIWAAVRGLEPKKMLGSTTVFMERAEPIVEEIEDTIKAEEEKAVQKYAASNSMFPYFESNSGVGSSHHRLAAAVDPKNPRPQLLSYQMRQYLGAVADPLRRLQLTMRRMNLPKGSN